MENRQTSKQVTYGERTYEVKKMDPRTACWLFSTMASRAEGKTILMALGKCSKEEFDQIQDLALRKVYFLDIKEGTTFPTPVLGASGAVSLPLEADEVYGLMTDSIMFSLSPFLVGPESSSPKN